MDLSTTYLGLDLPHPFMPGACPLTADLDSIKRMEDGGAAAIVMHSLFEEQIVREEVAVTDAMQTPAESFAEALSYFPDPSDFHLGPEEYLEQIRLAKEAVGVPIIASLNGTSLGGWLKYARLIAEAGADGLELNVYNMPSNPEVDGLSVEKTTVEMVAAVKEAVNLPVAIKVSPFYSSLPSFAQHLDNIGADGLVLFNRFYQPDINVEELEVERKLQLSTSSELLLRLRWLAVISGMKHTLSLAVTGGVHTGLDAVKASMTGAEAIQVVSALLIHGPNQLNVIKQQMVDWMEEHEYESLKQMTGSMNLQRCPDASAYERANYMHILQSWEGAV
jgi:dihydroorotate dehydrogenase (fumarate)